MIGARSALVAFAVLLCGACGDAIEPDSPVAESQVQPGSDRNGAAALRERAWLRFEAIEAQTMPVDGPSAARFDLGRRLFFEKRLSADGQVACATCHIAAYGGGDGLAKSLGVMGRQNPRNAPSVFNAGLQTSQHWYGDRESLADQAARSPLGKVSFGNQDEAEAMGRLRDAGYEPDFERAFPDVDAPMSLERLGEAIETFEQTLRTPASFDDFLNGDDDALDARQRAGLALFMDIGCADCHSGAGVGGGQLAKFGRVEAYALATGVEMPDQGRVEVTRDEADRFVFKVPMLRNVAETQPYFHDGSVVGLEQAVRVMAKVQLGRDLTDGQVRILEAFLSSLSGSAPEWFSAPE